MPVVNFPKDRAAVLALFQDKNAWYEAHKIAVEKSPSKRLAELERLGATKGSQYRSLIADRVEQVKAARKEKARTLADAASAKYQSFDFNSLREAIEA